MKMEPGLFAKYEADPLGMDALVRQQLKIPDDNYYCVAMMNQVGTVAIIPDMHRTCKTPKISKSDPH